MEGKVEKFSRPGDAVIGGEKFDKVAVPGGDENGIVPKLNLERFSGQVAVAHFAVVLQVQNLDAESAGQCQAGRIVGENGTGFQKAEIFFPADGSRCGVDSEKLLRCGIHRVKIMACAKEVRVRSARGERQKMDVMGADDLGKMIQNFGGIFGIAE